DQAGTYHWLAKYSGDGNNDPAASTCASEARVVENKSQPQALTQIESRVKLGDTLTDNAGLSGATADAGGTISFYLFKPGDNCSHLGTAVYSSTGVPVSGNGTYHNVHSFPTRRSSDLDQAGTYHWLAKYSGDGNNDPAASTCASEA